MGFQVLEKCNIKVVIFYIYFMLKVSLLPANPLPDMVYIDNCICHQRISKAIVMLLRWKWYHFQYAKYQSPVILGPIKVVIPVFAKSHIISVTWCALSLGMTLFFACHFVSWDMISHSETPFSLVFNLFYSEHDIFIAIPDMQFFWTFLLDFLDTTVFLVLPHATSWGDFKQTGMNILPFYYSISVIV